MIFEKRQGVFLFFLIFFNTVAADSIEIGDVILHFTGTAFLGFFHNEIDVIHFKIHNPVAFGTDKMMMTADISIKAISASPGKDFVDLSQVREKPQIPINSSETDVGELLANIHINSIRSGMITPAGQKFFDALPLFAVFQDSHGRTSSLQ
jgi:hypothetical protein